MTMAAAAKVLQNFELLQSILLHTDSYEILVATSVCTSWRAVVENSKTLRNHIMSNPIRKPLWPERQALFRPHCDLNGSPQDVWHFFAKTTNRGCLFVYCDLAEDVEIFLLAPVQKDAHLTVLDDAYDMFAVAADFRPELEFRTKTGKKVCRTKSKTDRRKYPLRWRHFCYPIVCGGVLRAYLSTFYADHYGPGVELGY
jgi:hypothetical protein